jgi:SulP family sulfate permease
MQLSGAMSFGAANEMMRRILSVKPVDVLIIDLADVPSVDGSAALSLEEIIQRAKDADQEVLVVGMQFGVARVLGRLGILDEVRDTVRFSARLPALDAAMRIISDRSELTGHVVS